MAFKIELALTQALLVTLDHHKDDLLVLIWALEEILEISLLLDFLVRLVEVFTRILCLIFFVFFIPLFDHVIDILLSWAR